MALEQGDQSRLPSMQKEARRILNNEARKSKKHAGKGAGGSPVDMEDLMSLKHGFTSAELSDDDDERPRSVQAMLLGRCMERVARRPAGGKDAVQLWCCTDCHEMVISDANLRAGTTSVMAHVCRKSLTIPVREKRSRICLPCQQDATCHGQHAESPHAWNRGPIWDAIS